MMHGREKSDSAIIAGKPTNKAGQPAAEPVERRAEAKGNASQQSTRRTQSRVSVSHALERIRQTVTKKTLCRHTPKVGAVCPNWARTDLCGGRSVMSVPTAISEMSSKIIPLKGRADSRNPAEFWPQRLFPLELRHRADAARAASRRKVRARMANRNLPGFTETRLRGWACKTRTQKRRRKISL
jgi:hypothetical protein